MRPRPSHTIYAQPSYSGRQWALRKLPVLPHFANRRSFKAQHLDNEEHPHYVATTVSADYQKQTNTELTDIWLLIRIIRRNGVPGQSCKCRSMSILASFDLFDFSVGLLQTVWCQVSDRMRSF